MTRAFLLAGTLALALGSAAAAQTGTPDAPPLPAIPSTGGLGSVSTAPVPLTEDQKVAIARAVRDADRAVKVPPGVAPRVGAELPASMELYMLPDVALSAIPEAKPYRYTVVDDRIMLVDPTNMRVVDVFAK